MKNRQPRNSTIYHQLKNIINGFLLLKSGDNTARSHDVFGFQRTEFKQVIDDALIQLDKLEKNGISNVNHGRLDITFYRDDFRRRGVPLQPNQTKIDIILEGKKVVFVDDVLFTGRSVRSALDAIHSFGRPSEIELLVLIDRRFSRELPIQPDYTGKQVDSLASQKVAVEWKEESDKDVVYLIKPKDE